MREISFRGKRVDNGEWAFGYYANCAHPCGPEHHTGHYIITYPGNPKDYHEIYTATVGQYTGLTDKNGVKIFEGDLTYYNWGSERVLMSVIFEDGEFRLHQVSEYRFEVWDTRISDENMGLEIIGNIHDNLELL